MTVKWQGIAKLIEETGELQAVLGNLQTTLGKLMAYPDGQHPDMRYAPPLLQRLHDELADVIASSQFFVRHSPVDIDAESVAKRVAYKTERLEGWHKNGDGMTGVKVNP